MISDKSLPPSDHHVRCSDHPQGILDYPTLSCPLRSCFQNVLVTGGAGYIGPHIWFSSRINQLTVIPGTHVIYALQKTRRYKVISIDNYHNSLPASLARVAQLSKSELPQNPSSFDIESTEIDSIRCDLTKPEEIRAVFKKYGNGGIWGVIHIAVRALYLFCYAASHCERHIKLSVNQRRFP